MEQVINIEVKAILWAYEPLKNGEFSVKIRLTRYKDTKYITTGFTSALEDWNSELGKAKESHPLFLQLNEKIKTKLDEIEFQRRLAESKGEYHLTMAELKARIVSPKNRSWENKPLRILELFDATIKRYEELGNQSYANVFTSCKSTVNLLLNGKDKHFYEFTAEDARRYELLLTSRVNVVKSKSSGSSSPSGNEKLKNSSVSNYLRTFYRIWNIAIDEKKYVTKDLHPRQYINFKAYKKYKAVKRAMPREEIAEVESMILKENSWDALALKYWQFMYYCRGLEFVDMAYLRWKENIHGHEYIKYTRTKTGREIEFKLHPKAVEILEFFAAYPEQSDAGYVFPILFLRHNTPKRVHARLHDYLRRINKYFNKVLSSMNYSRRITTKSAKHSIVSNLNKLGMDPSQLIVVSEHETFAQLAVYLAEISSYDTAERMAELIK